MSGSKHAASKSENHNCDEMIQTDKDTMKVDSKADRLSSTVANDIVRELRPMEGNQGGLEVYGLPIEEKVFNASEKLRKCTFKRNYSSTPQSKTIIVLATIGSGKRTFINGLVNYVLNVNWSDNFRFKMVDNNRSSQWITKYRLCYTPGSRLNYNLNIIDTPGFGDTRGIQRDAEIFQQIKILFKTKIQTVDAVCIVVPNSSLRLTATQRYMFDSIMTIFGNDIKKNIFILITFADTPEPPVIDTLRNEAILFEKGFPFNNSALYANNHGGKFKFTKMFWDLGMDSFRSFVEELDRIQTASLNLTRDVLDKREQIEMFIINLHQYLQEGLCKLEEIRTVKKECSTMKENYGVAAKGLAGMEEVLKKLEDEYKSKQDQVCEIIDKIKSFVQ